MTKRPHGGEDLRAWGYWTILKLEILREYLERFCIASKSASNRVYLDAFAGQGKGVSRTTKETFAGSIRIALQVQDPPFTHVRGFELKTKAARLEAELKAEFPGRNIRVYGGDCNLNIPEALRELRAEGLHRSPTFAFLDPDGMEISWVTIDALSRHREPWPGRPPRKVELWLLFNAQGVLRTLSTDPTKFKQEDAARAERIFGTHLWRPIRQRRAISEVDGARARDELINLMRWRLENDLGYARTHPLELLNTKRHPLYTMIFATDDRAGDRIMSAIYKNAQGRKSDALREAIQAQKGQLALDLEFEDSVLPAPRYSYSPPWSPAGLTVDDRDAQEDR